MSILVLVTVWALPAAQADSFPGAIHARGNRATALHNTLLAVSLARYARAHDDAGAMVVAARILKGVRIEARDAHGHAVPTAIPRGLRVTSLLAEARAMPRGRELLRREVDTFQVIEHKGVLSSDYGTGLVSYGRALEAGETWQFEVVTEAQRSVTIAAIGDGDADIDLAVFDERGTLTIRDDAADPVAVVRWTPQQEARYRIRVVNKGVVNSYTVVLTD